MQVGNFHVPQSLAADFQVRQQKSQSTSLLEDSESQALRRRNCEILAMEIHQCPTRGNRDFRSVLENESCGGDKNEKNEFRGISHWESRTDRIPVLARSDRRDRRVLLAEDLSQDVGEDAAGAIVVFFYRGIDADDDGDIKRSSDCGVHAECGLLHGLEIIVDADEVEGGVAEVLDFVVVLFVDEVAGQHTHADEVRAVDALEGFSDHGFHS